MKFRKHKEIWPMILRMCRHEVKIYLSRPLLLFCLLAAPLICIGFFLTLMGEGLPTDLPAAVVDEDDTQVTRQFIRTMDALEQTEIVARYHSFEDAKKSMLRGEIYAIFYIPKGTTELAISQKQPHISFYTNETYFIPSALLMKDMRLACELMGLSLVRESMTAKGYTANQIMSVLQPITIEKHPLGNPMLNYSVYLCNTILPGIILILAMLCSAYVIGVEWKNNNQRHYYQLADFSPTTALSGKLLPITVNYSLMILLMDVILYKYLEFPCQCGIFPMWIYGTMAVMASQGMAIFIFGIFPGMMRFSMSVCSLLGILGISLSGFTFPVSAMYPFFQYACNLFPLRHYYLIYCNQALNGYEVGYVWFNLFMLLFFMFLPFWVIQRYRVAFLLGKYKP